MRRKLGLWSWLVVAGCGGPGRVPAGLPAPEYEIPNDVSPAGAPAISASQTGGSGGSVGSVAGGAQR